MTPHETKGNEMNEATKMRPEPKFAEGDWAFNEIMGHNTRILRVVWDESAHGYNGGWRYWMPGLGTLYPYAAKQSSPDVEYEETSPNCWAATAGGGA